MILKFSVLRSGLRQFLFFSAVLVGSFNTTFHAQEMERHSALGQYVVIGFPGITQTQLNQIKVEYQKHADILTAKYYYGNDKCMLLKMDLNAKEMTTYADIIKCTAQIYNPDKCFLKPVTAYAEIEPNLLNTTVVIIK